MLAVLLDRHGLIAYGPFDDDALDRGVAERFAAYLTREVGPANVVPADEVLALTRPVRWCSALRELLAFYETTTESSEAASDATETAPEQRTS